MTMPAQLSHKQKDPTNALVENEHQTNERNAVGNGECRICLKKSKVSDFYWSNLAEKNLFVKNILSTEWCSID